VKKTSTKNHVHTNRMSDRWEDIKSQLAEAADEQTQADVALVEATATFLDSQQAHQQAIARKTAAEKRLANIRAKLSVAANVGG